MLVTSASSAGGGELWSTWDVFEPDKCASVWLIKRHIDPDARFRFYPSGVLIEEGIRFDTPDAELRRYHDASTFETLIRRYELTGPGLDYLGRLMHDIEVNVWERKLLAESREIEHTLVELTRDVAPEEAVDACLIYFDGLIRRETG
ncbi:chromate resistance protein ChrB domain-containing protein [Thiohalocapsa sp. ML1]|uniref:chromate resistance protein ChrB domain-containing protein n=1 Tax=Thiohalocapsa sp. ML1 TaxID=1431688 RepID=UPI000732430B|nr:chromate resistance protein ChrB domain-containing protein [Thiohalocapsa sp. ML1]